MVEKQIAIIYAATAGFTADLPVESLGRYEQALYRFLETRKPGVLATIAEKKALDDALKAEINEALKEFGAEFAAAEKTAAVA